MTHERILICEECGGPCYGRDADGCAICDDCALETYGDLESLLDVALSQCAAAPRLDRDTRDAQQQGE